MSGELSKFGQMIGQMISERAEIQTAWVTVKSVDWEDKTMIATGLIDDLDYFDVLLGLQAQYKKPKTGTRAIIGIIGNQPGNSFLIDAEELEEVQYNIAESVLHIKEEGLIIKQGNESLKTVLNDMIDELNKIIVINGRSINVPAMLVIKQRLNKVLIG
ncbi:hypothetical protein HMPREF0765_4152 [Sphingobacterium spiritivorum ATCC 33300]|uniref:Uncharacterized protein n=1 Tax=Sphingobacterium spiritivorum ATCC 33300 TaxID=525372 RepID=C2G3J6_SPHSI|nr:hypothetical protein [Sphingobacterium spiritivorum]EEI90201.1 hypothetical protein HMPREF0765_4152 [Sphingobacterium spiritivorum ATCC 33300]QQS95162.1 hypothetical protein I6J03_17530 [Sphingobacterium spiritivorum]